MTFFPKNHFIQNWSVIKTTQYAHAKKYIFKIELWDCNFHQILPSYVVFQICHLSLDFLWEWRRVVYCPVIKMKGNKIVCIAVIKRQSDDRAMKKVHCTPLWSGMCPVPVQWRRWWCDMWTDVVSFIPNQNLTTKKPRLSLSLTLIIHIRPK